MTDNNNSLQENTKRKAIEANGFVHLHCHSAYSLAEGCLQNQQLIDLCIEDGMVALAVTDTMNLFGAYEFSQAAIQNGIKPIIGCQVKLSGNLLQLSAKSRNPQGLQKQQYDELVLLVQNDLGYLNLCKLISKAYLEGAPHEEACLHADWLDPINLDGLICLTGGLKGALTKSFLEGDHEHAEAILIKLKELFPQRLYVEIQRHDIREEKAVEASLIALADRLLVPLIASNDCYFKDEHSHQAHDALLCIADGVTVNTDIRRRVTPQHGFHSQEKMQLLFKDIPDALANSLEIAQRCNFFVAKAQPMLPRFPAPDGLEEGEYLKQKSREGLLIRLEALPNRQKMDAEEKTTFDQIYHDRLDHELAVILKSGYSGYFLIVSDFIHWALDMGIPVGPGRGSGAGSLVAYALKITNIDPIAWGLLFERFLNPERVSLPDFDIDFCPDRRDSVIHYVQEKYGADRVGQIITFGSLQARAALRDVGRVLEMPYSQVDRLCKITPNNPAKPISLSEAVAQEKQLQIEIANDEKVKHLFTIAMQLEGLYRHASTHAAGVVIADKPLVEILPLYRDPRSTTPTTQYSKDYAEAIGLVKFDFLGLKTLTIIDRACKLINQQAAKKDLPLLNIDHIPLDDQKTMDLFKDANTQGIFQLESVGMRQWLKELKPDHIDDIVALVALYRPGPMDNIPTYVACRHGRQDIWYPHDSTIPILKNTYGVAVYQEQVMQIAQVVAGFSLGTADQLRRIIGKKKSELLPPMRESFLEGAARLHNMKRQDGESLFDTLGKFAGYGFNKSHAVAYAVIAYQTAWIKANYPLEFYVSAMTQEIKAGSTDSLASFFADARRNKVKILPVDINHPHLNFTIETNPATQEKVIRYALLALKGVNELAITAIHEEYSKKGAFKDIFDFLERVPQLPGFKRIFEILIKAGAFDSLESNRRKLMENFEVLTLYGAGANQSKSGGPGLFGEDLIKDNRPALKEVKDWNITAKLADEAQVVGFYLTGHPLDSYSLALKRLDCLESAQLETGYIQTAGVVTLAGVVTSVRFRTIDAKTREGREPKKMRLAVLSLSDSSGSFEAAIYEPMLDEMANLLEVGRLLLLSASVKFDVVVNSNAVNSDDGMPPAPASESPNPEDQQPMLGQAESLAPKDGSKGPASSENEQRRMRLRVSSIKDLATAAADAAEGALITVIGKNPPFESLAKAIKDNSSRGEGNITLRLILDKDHHNPDEYECRLPGKYTISKDFERDILNIESVAAVEIL